MVVNNKIRQLTPPPPLQSLYQPFTSLTALVQALKSAQSSVAVSIRDNYYQV